MFLILLVVLSVIFIVRSYSPSSTLLSSPLLDATVFSIHSSSLLLRLSILSSTPLSTPFVVAIIFSVCSSSPFVFSVTYPVIFSVVFFVVFSDHPYIFSVDFFDHIRCPFDFYSLHCNLFVVISHTPQKLW